MKAKDLINRYGEIQDFVSKQPFDSGGYEFQGNINGIRRDGAYTEINSIPNPFRRSG